MKKLILTSILLAFAFVGQTKSADLETIKKADLCRALGEVRREEKGQRLFFPELNNVTIRQWQPKPNWSIDVKIEKAKEEAKKLKEINDRLTTEYVQELSESKAKRRQRKQEAVALKSALLEANEQRAQLEQDKADLLQDNADLLQDNTALKKDKAALKKDKADLLQDNTFLQEENADREIDNAGLCRQLLKMNLETDRLDAERENFKENGIQLCVQLAGLAKDLNECEHELKKTKEEIHRIKAPSQPLSPSKTPVKVAPKKECNQNVQQNNRKKPTCARPLASPKKASAETSEELGDMIFHALTGNKYRGEKRP